MGPKNDNSPVKNFNSASAGCLCNSSMISVSFDVAQMSRNAVTSQGVQDDKLFSREDGEEGVDNEGVVKGNATNDSDTHHYRISADAVAEGRQDSDGRLLTLMSTSMKKGSTR